MKHALLIVCLLLTITFSTSTSHAQDTSTECASPLLSLTDENAEIIAPFILGEDVVYRVRYNTDAPYDVLFRVPLDGNAPAEQRYAGEGYLPIVDREGETLLIENQNRLIILNMGDSQSEPFTVFEGEDTLNHAEFLDENTLSYSVVAENQLSLYHVDLVEDETTLITDQIGFNEIARFQEGDDAIVTIVFDDDDVPRIYRRALPSGETTLLSGDLNIEHSLSGGTYYPFFVTDNFVIFEARDENDQTQVYRASLDGSELTQLISAESGFGGEIALSPDERYLVYKDGENLYSVPVDASAEPQLIDTVTQLDRFHFTSDGEYLVYLSDGVLHRASPSGEDVQALDESLMIGTNFSVDVMGDQWLISSSFPNDDQFAVYQQPADLSTPMQIVFESVWDYTYGTFYLTLDDNAFVYRQFDGENTRLFYHPLDGQEHQIGCAMEGHVRLIELIDGDTPRLVFTRNDRELWVMEVMP